MAREEITASIEIRNLKTIQDLERVRELEAIIWSFNDSIPLNQTITVVKNGGFILGAFLHDELIGFQYSFPGFNGNKVYLCSHSLGIHPNYRKSGIGEKLKWAQKQLASNMGYTLITWTYDPLETVNGNLNLHKLGATCSTYIENAYGEMGDGINSDLPTDRFLVEWLIDERKPLKETVQELPRVIQTSFNKSFLSPYEIELNLQHNQLYVPVPGNFQEIKKGDLSLAHRWRKATRQVFSYYLTKDWQVTNLVKDNEQSNQYLYLVEKRNKKWK